MSRLPVGDEPDQAPAVEVVVPDDEDATAVGAMHLLSWHQTYLSAEHGVDAAWIEESTGFLASAAGDDFRRGLFAAQRADPASTFYRVARRGGEVVGFVHASRTTTADGQRRREEVVLEALYLLAAVQGSGLADRLMTAALDWAGGRAVELDVASYNARAVRFYRRHGFAPTGATGSFRDRVPTMAMRRAASA